MFCPMEALSRKDASRARGIIRLTSVLSIIRWISVLSGIEGCIHLKPAAEGRGSVACMASFPVMASGVVFGYFRVFVFSREFCDSLFR